MPDVTEIEKNILSDKYRSGVCQILEKVIRFDELRAKLDQIPDNLGLGCTFFLINEVQLEKLTADELGLLYNEKNDALIESGFYARTYQRVMYPALGSQAENGGNARGDSLVVGVKYNGKICAAGERLARQQAFLQECMRVLREDIAKALDAPVSFILEDGVGGGNAYWPFTMRLGRVVEIAIDVMALLKGKLSPEE